MKINKYIHPKLWNKYPSKFHACESQKPYTQREDGKPREVKFFRMIPPGLVQYRNNFYLKYCL